VEPSWQVKGVGDLYGDGRADILWRHATGQNHAFLMNGLSIASEGSLRTVADANWHVKGVADLNGDGRADILWRHAASGENYVYLMNGTSIAGEGYVRTVADLNWRVVALGDYDGDGRSDILWRHASSGENYLYPMDGTSIKSSEGYVRSVPPGTWAVVGGTGGDALSPPPARARVEESDAAVTLSAGWTQSHSRWGWSGGAAVQSTVPGATLSFTFTGTSVRWIGRNNNEGGIALVRVDGGPAREVDLFTRPNAIRTPVLTLYDLGPGQHTLTIEVTGRKNPAALSNVVTVDAFDLEPQIVSHLQETDPDMLLSAGWVHDDSSAWSGGGVGEQPAGPIGGMRFAEAAGEKATFKFRGTSIAWRGYRGPDGGIARVELDGVAQEVDTYAAAQKFQEVVFTATGLADTNHTLTIEVTGRKNPAATGTKIVADAFDVTTPGRRFQESEANITYTGEWIWRNVNRSWNEGAAHTTNTPGSRATFSFTGTSVSWIGCQKASIARAKIYVDGVFKGEIRNSKPVPIEGYQRVIYRVDGLTNGPHTLTIEHSPTGGTGFVVIDAFDVHP
jgi:hypothetical protein